MATPTFILSFTVYANAQQTEAAPAPAPNNIPSTNGTDLTVATGGIASAVAVGVAAYLKDRADKNSVTKNIRGTDVDVANFVALMSKFFQYSYIYKNYTISQIMDLPSNANPMDKTTLGQAISSEANGWVNFVQEVYNVPRPQMAVATPSVVTASQNTPPPPLTTTTIPAPTTAPPTPDQTPITPLPETTPVTDN